MDVQVKYVVCGHDDEDGWLWHCPILYDSVEEANARAEREAQYCSEVWVEKHTTHREIIKSISSPGLPVTALIPA